jgi:peptidoglycan hydrolase FlgJ
MAEVVQSPPLTAASLRPGADQPGKTDPLHDAAEQFEAVFLTQMLSTITKGLGGEQLFGGGAEQSFFHDMFTDEVAKLISRSGGVGVADAVLQEMLKVQEVA